MYTFAFEAFVGCWVPRCGWLARDAGRPGGWSNSPTTTTNGSSRRVGRSSPADFNTQISGWITTRANVRHHRALVAMERKPDPVADSKAFYQWLDLLREARRGTPSGWRDLPSRRKTSPNRETIDAAGVSPTNSHPQRLSHMRLRM